MIKYDHFEKYEWIGIFWAEIVHQEEEQSSNQKSRIQFPGKLTYSIEDGVQLSFIYQMGNKIKRTNYIHGVLENGEKCTLIGCFDPNRFSFSCGEVSIYKSKILFDSVIFGVHAAIEDKFDGISLDLTNFQEFCHPQGFRDRAKYSEKPIFTEYHGDIEVSLVNSAQFKSLTFNVDSLFYCRHEEAELEIKNAIKEVIEKYKTEEILTRTDIGWELILKNKGGFTVDEVIKHTLSIEQFLSLLLFFPTRRTKLNILRCSKEQPGCFRYLSVLTTLFDISKFKEKVLKHNLSHISLPINSRNIDFGKTIKKWFAEQEKIQMYAFSVYNNFGRITEPEIRSEIIVNLAQIELIAHSLGKTKPVDKYDYPISYYGKGQIEGTLRESLKLLETEKIGVALSELRSDIAHFGRPVTRSKKMSLSDLYTVQKCLSFIICLSIYNRLEVPERNIHAFRESKF